MTTLTLAPVTDLPMTDIPSADLSAIADLAAYTVADYLLDRLAECCVDTIYGVPGDFTLGLLDHVERHPVISWVGTANELGAGYAADGYARMRGLGVVCSTFGVGELSTVNAVAGAYAEHVPVLHLVGAPTTAVQAAGRPTHHTFGDGDFRTTLRMSQEVTVAQAVVRAASAHEDIDRVLSEMIVNSRPGYLSLAADVAEAPCEPPTRPLEIRRASSDPRQLERFAHAAAKLLDGHTPVVLADIFVHRARAQRELDRLIDAGGLRYASLLWGRRVVDESGPDYLGIYSGAASDPEVRGAIEDAACLITAGVCFTDLTSGFFSQKLRTRTRIDVQPHSAAVAGEVFAGIEMRDALEMLTGLVVRREHVSGPVGTDGAHTPTVDPDEPLTQRGLWGSVADALRPGDVVVADQGTSYYGIAGQRMPRDCVLIGQPLWASIGYALPALIGAAAAAPGRRPVLLIGDGAAQMTIAELGTLIRLGIPAVIVVVNNSGYTVERAIHGAAMSYNDIAAWRWTLLPYALGGTGGSVRTHRAGTAGELDAAFRDAAEHPGLMTVIEAVTDAMDVPPLLEALASAAATANTAALR